MRPLANFTLHAALAVALAALAASSAAVAPAASGEVFVKFPATASGKGEQIEVQSFQWGSTQAGRVSKVDSFTVKQGVKPAESGDMTLKGSKIGENATRSGSIGASESLTVGGAQTEGQATGKRQHKPLTMHGYYDPSLNEPLPSGSLRVKVKMPWLACKAGTRFPELVLGDGARSYRLIDAVVTGCGQSSGGRPMESISFSYARIDY